MTTVNKLPPDVGELDPRLREWIQQYVESVSRPRKIVTASFPAANTEVRIRHNLPSVPGGWVVMDLSAAAIIYKSKAPDAHYVYLKSDTAGVTVKFEIS